MATDYCFGEDYNDKFDARWYLKTYYSSCNGSKVENEFMTNILQRLHLEFSNTEHHQGGRLLDFGTGPSIHSILSASKVYSDITLADYSVINRKELNNWINKEQYAHDWNSFTSAISSLEGTISPEAVELRVRKAIREVIHCDIIQTNPLYPEVKEPYDCIVTSSCLEACTKDLEGYQQSVKNLSTLIKHNGSCVVIGVLNESFYAVGENIFFALRLSKDDIKSAFTDAGFSDIDFKCYDFMDPTNPELKKAKDAADFSGYFVMYAKKK